MTGDLIHGFRIVLTHPFVSGYQAILIADESIVNILNTIKDYYPKVDAGNTDWVIALFAEDGDYHRADVSYMGKKEISDFYQNARKIKGKHTLESIFAEGNTVAVSGVFEGVGADNSPKKIRFADFWTFNQEGLVCERKTYLASGSDYVRD